MIEIVDADVRLERVHPIVSAQWDPDADDGRDGALATSSVRPKLAKPPMYKVVIFNDDYTPMEGGVRGLYQGRRGDQGRAS